MGWLLLLAFLALGSCSEDLTGDPRYVQSLTCGRARPPVVSRGEVLHVITSVPLAVCLTMLPCGQKLLSCSQLLDSGLMSSAESRSVRTTEGTSLDLLSVIVRPGSCSGLMITCLSELSKTVTKRKGTWFYLTTHLDFLPDEEENMEQNMMAVLTAFWGMCLALHVFTASSRFPVSKQSAVWLDDC